MGDLSEQDREALLVAMRSVLGNYDPATGPLFALAARNPFRANRGDAT